MVLKMLQVGFYDIRSCFCDISYNLVLIIRFGFSCFNFYSALRAIPNAGP